MTPLRIDMEIGGPMYPQAHPLHLDSLIASQMVLAQSSPPNETQLAQLLDTLPFERAHFGEEWVWKASAVQFVWEGLPTHESWTMPVSNADLYQQIENGIVNMRGTSKIDTARGEFKAGMGLHESRWAKSARAWAIGDKKILERLLGTLHQIGTKRRLGAGRIRSLTVNEDPEASTLWANRYLPVSAKQGIPVEGTFRPPYFARDQQKMVLNNLSF